MTIRVVPMASTALSVFQSLAFLTSADYEFCQKKRGEGGVGA